MPALYNITTRLLQCDWTLTSLPNYWKSDTCCTIRQNHVQL